MPMKFTDCLLIAALGLVSFAVHGQSLKTCLLERNPPYSQRSSASGIDHDIAAALAGALGRDFEAVWVPNDPGIVEIDESDFPLRRLARAECDVLLSVPGPATDTLTGHDDLILGEPYYGAGFELVSCGAELAPNLRGLRGRKVAIQSQTIAHFAMTMVKAKPQNFFSLDDAYAAVREGTVEAGVLWGPAIGALLSGQGGEQRCGLVEDYQPPTAVRWNLHFAVRMESGRLTEQLNAALATMRSSGQLQSIMRGYGVPPHAPFDSTYSLGAINDLQRPSR